ncbi:DUF397 domain-containing protein [Streptomyces bambusae]|uniref:DUF397 domain-containing protein n=1 Tax=Streptomyces bambusae TaxID=1550616 RepID=A0ABS6ZEH4_9ACTN|nr:DUF397 domain-containing protein [Streptomyces bambusae]MBW5486163.1 DUF397 domain-containing protein [Streptomyces bambusae]
MSAIPPPPGGLENSAIRWRRSSRSTGMNNCVEAAALAGGLLAVRDSKRTDGPAVLFTGPAWDGFLAHVRTDSA